jgi:hypothetical protein
MSLTAQDLARVEAAEASQQRMLRLQRMSHYELRALLSGDPTEAAVWITRPPDCSTRVIRRFKPYVSESAPHLAPWALPVNRLAVSWPASQVRARLRQGIRAAAPIP